MLKNISILSLLLAITACTQPPAHIELKGSQKFSRDGNSGYRAYSKSDQNNSTLSSQNITVSQTTEQSAAVDSIGISDLSAPPKESAKTEVKNEIKAEQKAKNLSLPSTQKEEPSKDNNIGAVKTTVNPWTNKPRSEIETNETVSEAKHETKINTKGEKVVLIKNYAENKAEPDEKAKNELKQNLDEEIKSEQQKPEKKAKNSDQLKWPVASKKVISSFGVKGEGKANDGINIAAKDGEPVWAVADGEVTYASNDLKGFGNMVFIKHKGGKTSSYAHLGRLTVDKYDRVKQGDVIGYVGLSGNTKKPQLFFSIHKGKEALDPQKQLSKDLAGL